MATELIASGTTYAASADFTVTAGTPRTLHIHSAAGGVDIAYDLYQKSSAAAYQHIERLTMRNIVEKGTLFGAGVFQCRRVPGANASSLEID